VVDRDGHVELDIFSVHGCVMTGFMAVLFVFFIKNLCGVEKGIGSGALKLVEIILINFFNLKSKFT